MDETSLLKRFGTETVAAFRSFIPSRLDELPRDEHGIYGLIDHRGLTGQVRYIGLAAGRTLRRRVWGDHVQGTGKQNGNSHKFGSQIYNFGRMFVEYGSETVEARYAKELRAVFCREYCRAVYVSVAIPAHLAGAAQLRTRFLEPFENAVKAEARNQGLDWFAWDGQAELRQHSEEIEFLIDELLRSRPNLATPTRLAAYNSQFEVWKAVRNPDLE